MSRPVSTVLISRIFRFAVPVLVGLLLNAAPLSAQDDSGDQSQEKAEEKVEDGKSSPAEQPESSNDEKPEKEAASGKKQADDEAKGEEDFATATALRLKLRSKRRIELAEMDRVIELCESAIKKGLSKDSEETANELLQGVLFDYAKAVADPIFSKSPPDPRWQFLRQQALKKLDRLEELGNEWSEPYILMAKLNALPDGNRDRALDAASKAVKYAGEDIHLLSEALYIRGSLTEDEQAQMADFNQAVKIDPDNIKAVRGRALIYLVHKEYEKAIDDFERLVELTNGDPIAYQQLIESMLFADDRMDEALEVADEALRRDEKQPGLYRLRARIFLMQAGELEDSGENKELSEKEREELNDEVKEINSLALESLNRAIALEPRDTLSMMMRAEINLRNDDIEAAKKDIDRLLALEPRSAHGIFLRSIISSASGDFPAAIRDLELLVQSDPDDLRYRLQLASMYSADGRSEKAIKMFEEILEDDTDNASATRGLADAYLGKGDHEKSLKYFNKALELAPEDDHILNNLAWLLATSPNDKIRDGKRSVELGLKACEVTDYQQAHILSTLAAGYAEIGDFEKARQWSAKSVELADESNLEDLKKELESYKQNKPWREKQEEEKKEEKSDSGGGDFEF